MFDQATKAHNFAKLHIKGKPVIIYNAWDGGSAIAIASAGAKAIATGDHPVGFAHGFSNDNFDDFTFDIYLATIKEIAARVGDLPFSVDISNAEGLDINGLQDRIRMLMDIGVVGINFEDRLADSSGVEPIDVQLKRIEAIRATADDYGVPLFINARTDLFTTAGSVNHSELIDGAVARAEAYESAKANGFFVPGLMDIALIQQLCEKSPLPVNIIRLPGAPSTSALVEAGVSRISYGPVPQMQMIDWLSGKAKEALSGQI
jgi:2-methylisocitrate lyase-like PEP mutase family enzyme